MTIQVFGKKGDPYLRTLLVHSARAFYSRAKSSRDPRAAWVLRLAEAKGAAVAIVALAAKHARIIWAMLSVADVNCTLLAAQACTVRQIRRLYAMLSAEYAWRK